MGRYYIDYVLRHDSIRIDHTDCWWPVVDSEDIIHSVVAEACSEELAHKIATLLNNEIGNIKMKYTIEIKGKEKRWSFPVEGTPEDAKDWEDDGLNVLKIIDIDADDAAPPAPDID